MDYRQITAPCGLDCFNCSNYLVKDNKETRAALAERWDVPIERAFCRGCRNESGIVPCFNWNEPCNVYKCIQNKDIDFCSDCPDFPCDHLHPFADRASQAPHNTKVYNLCLIKKMGVDKWAKTKAKSVNDTYFNAPFRLH
ncbi:DUF3795 domain-containing protein [Chloroflexota bacterium]